MNRKEQIETIINAYVNEPDTYDLDKVVAEIDALYNPLCPVCGAHLENWLETFREIHKCEVKK